MKRLLMLMGILSLSFCGSVTTFTGLQSTGPWALSGYQVASPSNVTTINIVPTMSYLILTNAQTVVTLGVTLTSANAGYTAVDGQIYSIVGVSAVTSLNVSSSSTISGTAAKSLTSGSRISYLFRKIVNTFYRVE